MSDGSMPDPLSFDRQLPAMLADPYPLYRRLQDEAPIHRSERLKGWILSRYDDVKLVLNDARFSSSWLQTASARRHVASGSALGRMHDTMSRWMANVDPPEHTRLRTLANHAFTQRSVERLRPRIRALVDEALDRAAPRGEMELMGELASGLPVQVIGELMGLPAEDHAQLKGWSDALALLVGNAQPRPGKLEGALAAVDQFTAYFRGQVERRRRQPADDLLSNLLAARERGALLSDAELLDTAIFLVGAGHETTTSLIGNGVLALLRHPDQLRRLREGPALSDQAVDELLRYDGPVQLMQRIALQAVELHGTRIEAGEIVHLLLGAANRDPRQFADPDRLDLDRKSATHVAFGHGLHYCLGAPLARMEVSIAVGTIARRLAGLRLGEGALRWTDSLKFRGLLALPLRFDR